jgi:tRNA nucleotidyltransferase (CCA-adding enzyme)
MFYDVKLNCVVDETGLGKSDLKNKILRTPLDPQYTFQTDPIRIFRAV